MAEWGGTAAGPLNTSEPPPGPAMPVIATVMLCVAGETYCARRLLADVVWPAAAAPTARELARANAAAGPRVADLPLGPLGPVAFTRVRHRQVVSAGALESYADCPVKWLVERELRPYRLEPEPDAIARGNYMHAVLERTLTRLGDAITEASVGRAQEILGEVIAEQPARLAVGRGAAERAAALREIEADLRRYVDHEARSGWGWPPRHVELRFGFVDDDSVESASVPIPLPSLPPLELAGGLRVRGAIDRVDVDPAGGRAIVAPFAAGVFENDRRGAEDVSLELADAAERAVAIAERLRTGGLEPCPETCSGGGCLYPGICRSEW